MINANELRITNKVYDNGKICTIESINAFADGEADVYLVETGNAGMFIDPIPLTEDILLKCGFEKHSNSNEFWNLYTLKNGWYISQALHIEDSAGVNFGCFYWSGEFIEIKHLHQLQNLFFCLCGKELTIKL